MASIEPFIFEHDAPNMRRTAIGYWRADRSVGVTMKRRTEAERCGEAE